MQAAVQQPAFLQPRAQQSSKQVVGVQQRSSAEAGAGVHWPVLAQAGVQQQLTQAGVQLPVLLQPRAQQQSSQQAGVEELSAGT
eukprot:3094519-Pleurochrysis_carterae.AAC.1